MYPTAGFNTIADRYVAILNEPNAPLRRKLIDDLWAEDGVYYNRLFASAGRDAVDIAMSAAHQEYIGKGFVFRSCADAYGHHNGLRFHWVLSTAATGEVDTYGEEFLLIDDEGRIHVDYQFGLRPPAI